MTDLKNRYVIKDWATAIKVLNENDINLSIAVTEDVDVSKHINGYIITIYNKLTGIIETQVPVEFDEGWSLNTDDCIDMLNSYGFNVEFDYSGYQYSDHVKTTLESLLNLGYKYIYRQTKPFVLVRVFTDNEYTALFLNHKQVAERVINCSRTGTGLGDVLKCSDNFEYRFLQPNHFHEIEELLKNLKSTD